MANCQLRRQLRLDSVRTDHAVYIKQSQVRTIRTMSDIGDSLSLTYRLLETGQSELPNLACTCLWPP